MCTDCPLLNKPLENGCPADSSESACCDRIRQIFSAGELIFEENDLVTGIYCVQAGKAALIKQAEEGEWAVAVVTPGDVLGMPDIINEGFYHNGALALENTSLCFIPKEKAQEIFRKDPSIMLRIMRRICARIASMEQHTWE